MTDPVSLLAAEMAAAAHARGFSAGGAEVIVAEVAPLRADAGWVAWLTGAEYARTHDPMDFVVAPALLITAGPTVTPLPTAISVGETLCEMGLG
jgi:hypothetical protein